MKKSYFVFYVFLIVFIFKFSTSYGQDGDILDRPESFFKISDDRRLKYDPDSPGTNQYWIVFSSQDNNPTYKTPDGRDVKKYPSFLEKMYITEVKGKYAHVYKDAELNRLDWTFSKNKQDYGWIELKNLILSPYCLVEPKSQIAKKCMILNTYSSLKKNANDNSQSDFVKFYLDPNLEQETGEKSKIFQIFYIYRVGYKNGRYSLLVGTSNKILDPEDTDEVRNTIKGWIPADRVVDWNTRVAVEPNFESDAANERKNEGIKTTVFESYDKSQDFKQGNPVNPKFVVWNKDTYANRKPGEWIRFPLINQDKGMYTLGVMGSLDNLEGETLYSTEENAVIRAKTTDAALKLRKVNVVFIVDGTSSMGKYFQSSIVPAIRETINKLVDKQQFNDFHFGALIYRDADEGNRLIETIPLTTNYDDVITSLKRVEAVDKHDLSKGEALYKGIYSGFRGVLNSNDETNIVIIIGDAGNREDKRTHIDEEQLVNIIYSRGANIICFQVNNGSDPAYDDYKTQTMRLVNEVAKKHEKDMQKTYKAIGKSYKQLKIVESGNNSYVWDGARYFECLYADKGKEKSVSSLKSAIVRAISKRNKRTNEVITTRNMVLEEGVSMDMATKTITEETSSSNYDQTDALGAGFIKLMKDAGLTDDEIKKAVQDKVQIYDEGYSPITSDKLSYPLYQRVLLYSAEEFSRMYTILTDLSEARKAPERRELLYDTWVETLGRYLGEIDKEEVEDMSLGEIQELVFGLPGADGLIKTLTLSDIKDESKLDDKALDFYLISVKKKAREFERIANYKDYPYLFHTNNKKYYWIDENMIP